MSADTPTILKKILDRKRDEVAERRLLTPLSRLQEKIVRASPPRGFYSAIVAKIATGQPAVIAEIKKASPSAGIIMENYDPLNIAKIYNDNKATCLSILTEEDFF